MQTDPVSVRAHPEHSLSGAVQEATGHIRPEAVAIGEWWRRGGATVKPGEGGRLMGMILAFLPWIIFGLLSHHHFMLALGLSLVASTVQVVLHWRNPKILEQVSLGFFLFALVALFVFHWQTLAHHMGLAVHLLLAGVAWGSLAVGVPFTVQYAREEVPEQFWSTPSFLRTNQWITAVWGVDFLCQAAVMEYQAAYGGVLPSILGSTLTVLCVSFTFWFPKYRRRLAAQAAEAARVSQVRST